MFIEITTNDGSISLKGEYRPQTLPESAVADIHDELLPILPIKYKTAYITFTISNMGLSHIQLFSRYLFFLETYLDEVNVLNTEDYTIEREEGEDVQELDYDSPLEYTISTPVYSSKDHFFTLLSRYVGKHEPGKIIRERTLDELRSYFKENDVYDETLCSIFVAMKKIKRPYYEYASYYANQLFGKEYLDISRHMEAIITIYNTTQIKYQSLTKTRKNNISTTYRMYRTLEKAGVSVDERDFKLPSTKFSKQENARLWNLISS